MVDRTPADTKRAPEQRPAPVSEPGQGVEAVLVPGTRVPSAVGTVAGLPGGVRRRPASVLALQRVVGNSTVARLLREVEEEVAEDSEDSGSWFGGEPESEPAEASEPAPQSEPSFTEETSSDSGGDESAPEPSIAEQAAGSGAGGVVEDAASTESDGGGFFDGFGLGDESPAEPEGGDVIEGGGVAEEAAGAGAAGEVIDDEGIDVDEEDDGPSLSLPGFLTGGLIVDDGSEPSENQLTTSAFLSQLRSAVTPQANAIVADAGIEVDVGAGIDFWFGKFGGLGGSAMERSINAYAPSTLGAGSAGEIVETLAAKVMGPVQTWVATGELVGVPDVPGLGAPLFDPGAFFKAAVDAAPVSADPLVLRSRLGAGEPLTGDTGSVVGDVFGHDFSDVRIHRDGVADSLASGLSARAFTVGSHVAFAANEYQPGTPVGDALIAHELAHVAQQRQCAASGVQTRGDGDESALEADADRAAVSAVVALRGGKDRLATWAKTIGPNLRSGLRLQRCKRSSKADPGPLPTVEQQKAHIAALDGMLADPVNKADALLAKLGELSTYAGHMLLKVNQLRETKRMAVVAVTPKGPEIMRSLIDALRTTDYAAFSLQLRPNGEDPDNILERDEGRLLANQLEAVLNGVDKQATAADDAAPADLIRLNAAISADPRLEEYRAAGLKFPFTHYSPGTERDGGLYYAPGISSQGATNPVYLDKGSRFPTIIYIQIGRRTLFEDRAAHSDDFVRSALFHEFQHYRQYLDFRNEELNKDERVEQLKVEDTSGEKGEPGPSFDVEAITAQLVNDIATLTDDAEVKRLLRYLSEKWNFAFPTFRERAIAAMKDPSRPLGKKGGGQTERLLGLIKEMKLHTGPKKKPKKGDPPNPDLASLYQALGGK